MPPTPAAERTVAAAAAVVTRYYAALGRRDYRAAYAIWHGRRGFAAFRAGFAHTVWTRATLLPPFESDFAMGSAFATIRVRVDARLDDGRRQRFVGRYVLRRVNDVDGSTAAQRRWHIESARLLPAA